MDGVVVEMKKSSSNSSQAPVIGFTAKDGNEYRFASLHYNKPPRYRVGQKVGVIYPYGIPDDARINDFRNLWLGFFMIFVLGVILVMLFFYHAYMGFSRKMYRHHTLDS